MLMTITEEIVRVPAVAHATCEGMLAVLRRDVEQRLAAGERAVRFVVTDNTGPELCCELGVLRHSDAEPRASLFSFRRRTRESAGEFNGVFLVPTGIGAEIGGHSGDSGPAAHLIASVCDRLITHPNVGNAADINELPANCLYVEGSVISDVLMGASALNPVRSNRILMLMETHTDPWFMDATVNMASAARAAAGMRISEVVVLPKNFSMRSVYATSGRAAGLIEGLESVYGCLQRRRGQFDAVAISSLIKVPPEYHHQYFSDNADVMVNPWGGVEAMLTHAVSRDFLVPAAHAPMMTSREVQTMDYGPVDPRKAAEPVSATYLFSVLKGLHRSPAIVPLSGAPGPTGTLAAENIHFLVIPDGCVGLPVLASLAQKIPIIAVRGNRNCMKNRLDLLPGAQEGIVTVANYLEAAGAVAALRAGISLESVRRPIAATPVIHEARALQGGSSRN